MNLNHKISMTRENCNWASPFVLCYAEASLPFLILLYFPSIGNQCSITNIAEWYIKLVKTQQQLLTSQACDSVNQKSVNLCQMWLCNCILLGIVRMFYFVVRISSFPIYFVLSNKIYNIFSEGCPASIFSAIVPNLFGPDIAKRVLHCKRVKHFPKTNINDKTRHDNITDCLV